MRNDGHSDFCKVCDWAICYQLNQYFALIPDPGNPFTGAGATNITRVSLPYPPADYLLLYSSDTGAVTIFPCQGFAHGAPQPAPSMASAIDPAWMLVRGFSLYGIICLWVHNFFLGTQAIYRFDVATGSFVPQLAASTGNSVPWTHAVTFLDSGMPHLLTYNRFTGQAAVQRIDALSQPPTVLASWDDPDPNNPHGVWTSGSSHLEVLTNNGLPYVFTYEIINGSYTLGPLRTPAAAGPVWLKPSGLAQANDPQPAGYTHFLSFTSPTGLGQMARYSMFTGWSTILGIRQSLLIDPLCYTRLAISAPSATQTWPPPIQLDPPPAFIQFNIYPAGPGTQQRCCFGVFLPSTQELMIYDITS
jgi:hypothetical protein